MEHSHSKKIEFDNKSLNRINLKKLKINPHKEVARYIEENAYYTTIWRPCIIMASIITIMLIYYMKSSNYEFNTTQTVLVFVFISFICYNCLNYKMRHQYSFINRSTIDVLSEISRDKEISKLTSKLLENYSQITP